MKLIPRKNHRQASRKLKDLLFGRTGNDVLTDGSADDQLFGEAGNDTLLGTAGDDVLIQN